MNIKNAIETTTPTDIHIDAISTRNALYKVILLINLKIIKYTVTNNYW